MYNVCGLVSFKEDLTLILKINKSVTSVIQMSEQPALMLRYRQPREKVEGQEGEVLRKKQNG